MNGKITLKPLTMQDVEFTFEAEEEDTSPESTFGEEEKEQAEYIRGQLDSGNPYAWFCAKVTARWNGFEVSDYLGCCSYQSEADFKSDGYYSDMQNEALARLNETIAATFDQIRPLIKQVKIA